MSLIINSVPGFVVSAPGISHWGQRSREKEILASSPAGLVARIPGFHSSYPGSIPSQGIMILLHAIAYCSLTEIRRKGGRKSGTEAGRFQKSSQIEYLQ